MKEIDIHNADIKKVVSDIMQNVDVINNAKRRISKNTEFYFKCGGGYDTESTTILNTDNSPKYAFVYHVQIMINGNYITTRYLNDITVFFRELSRQCKAINERAKLIIWVANLAHEWAFFKRQFSRCGSVDIFAKSKRQVLKITVNNNIEFRECIGLFGISLSDIAEKHTATQKLKGDLDYTLYRTPETALTDTEKKYCYNDVKILDELSYKAFEMFTLKSLKMPMTKTGILRNKCKSKIKNIKQAYIDNSLLMPATIDEYVLMRKYLYNGGLCGGNAFYNGKLLHDVICCDLTSDYPAQMYQQMYPSGELIKLENPPEIFKYSWHPYIIDVTFKYIRAKSAHCSVSETKILNARSIKHAVKNNGKILYAENVRLMLNNVDLDTFKMMYDFDSNVMINNAYYFTKSALIPKYLRECISEDYKLKNELKEKGLSDTLEYKLSKESVNSYYGMCATRLYDCNYTYGDSDRSLIHETTKDKITDKLIGDYLTNTIFYKQRKQAQYEKLKSHVWLNPYIAYWCTSYARKILCEFISEFPDLIIQYDTDSIYFCADSSIASAERVELLKHKISEYNLKIKKQNDYLFKGDKHFETLGQWDIGKPYKNFKTLGAKRYMYEKYDGKIKTVVAGLVKGTLEKQAKENNVDCFEFFKDKMTISNVNSKKLASIYCDDSKRLVKVTDYKGNESIVEIGTYHALYSIEFTLELAHDIVTLLDAMSIEKALPYDERIITNSLEKILSDME